MSEQFARLEIKGRDLFLNGSKLKGVESFKAVVSSDIPEGKVELELKIIADFPDNKQEQDPLLTE